MSARHGGNAVAPVIFRVFAFHRWGPTASGTHIIFNPTTAPAFARSNAFHRCACGATSGAHNSGWGETMTASITSMWQVHPGRRVHTFGGVLNECRTDAFTIAKELRVLSAVEMIM